MFSRYSGVGAPKRDMKQLIRTLIVIGAPIALLIVMGACTIIPAGGGIESVSLPQGSAAALGQRVAVGALLVTPQAVVEDSRCPINARCIWAGRLVVKTRIDGKGWRETADLTLGEPYATHGTGLALTSGEPGREAGAGKETKPADYRFIDEAK